MGNSVEPHDSNEKATFILVQIIRFQSGLSPQSARVRISRFGQWQRENTTLRVIDDQPLDSRLTIAEFLSIHERMTSGEPGDAPIQFNGDPWHGRPVSGIYSSIDAGSRFSTPEIRKYTDNPLTVLSNWLFLIQTARPNRTWFYVNTPGTQKIVIRTFSPNRSQFDRLVEVQVN